MVLEYTPEEIVEYYTKLDNIDELFNSDILVFPFDGEDNFRDIQLVDLKTHNKELNIKYYAQDQDKVSYYFSASGSDSLNIGVMVISTLAGLITLGEYLRNKYGNKLNTLINVQLFNKTVNNTYIYHNYKGDINSFCTSEVERMEADFKLKSH